jgi:hypothetical protein
LRVCLTTTGTVFPAAPRTTLHDLVMQWGNTKAIRFGWIAAVCAVALEARAENEFVAHSAENYGSSGYCSGDALTNANEDATYLDNGLGGYDQLEYWTNLYNDGRDFADQNNFAWGADENDPAGTDFADVIFFSGHGSGSCSSPARAWITPGDNADGCTIYLAHATSASRHVTFGGTVENREAKAFVTFACQTATYCQHTGGAYDAMSQGQFNILNGFHGDVAEVAGYQSDLGSYSNAVGTEDIGGAWLDWMYDPDVGGGADNCPTSIVFGANSSETADYFSHAGWYDFHDNGARTTHTYYRLCGCDPVNGVALPSC